MRGREKGKRKKRLVHIVIVTSILFIVGLMWLFYLRWIDLDKNKEAMSSEQAQVSSSGEDYDNHSIESIVKDANPETSDKIKEIVVLNVDDLLPGEVIESSQVQDYTSFFISYNIEYNDDIFKRINGKSYRDNDDISLSDLRYLKMLHYNYKHEIQVGEMIVNADISEDVLSIFKEFYLSEYEIESMRLIDDFWMGDGSTSDDESIRNNNTSAFCYRTISRGSKLSNHAFGRAIDINPKQNPYIWRDNDGNWKWSAENAENYVDRSSGAEHMILKDDVCVQTFNKYGFEWGGNWTNPVDYQHFEALGNAGIPLLGFDYIDDCVYSHSIADDLMFTAVAQDVGKRFYHGKVIDFNKVVKRFLVER